MISSKNHQILTIFPVFCKLRTCFSIFRAFNVKNRFRLEKLTKIHPKNVKIGSRSQFLALCQNRFKRGGDEGSSGRRQRIITKVSALNSWLDMLVKLLMVGQFSCFWGLCISEFCADYEFWQKISKFGRLNVKKMRFKWSQSIFWSFLNSFLRKSHYGAPIFDFSETCSRTLRPYYIQNGISFSWASKLDSMFCSSCCDEHIFTDTL